MNKETISVIITVYNRENLIDRAIRSVLDQTEVNTELVLIDDGSTDRSLEICRSYEARYGNVKVVPLTNGGIARARNIGLENATGDYIVYLDDDDCMTPGSLKFMLDAMHKYDVDIVLGNSERHDENGNFVSESYLPDSIKNRVITEDDYWEAGTDKRGYFLFVVLWAKLYKKSVWKSIHFPEEYSRGEDEYVLPDILEQCNKLYVTDFVVHHQTMTHNSITRKSSIKSLRWAPESKLVTASKLAARKKYKYAVNKWGIACGEIITLTKKAENHEHISMMNNLYKTSCAQAKTLFTHFDAKKESKYICYRIYYPLLMCYKSLKAH